MRATTALEERSRFYVVVFLRQLALDELPRRGIGAIGIKKFLLLSYPSATVVAVRVF
jgi:hypothetical protein